jgi:glycosyltransferase involved in cell wall biosynthesis
VNKGGPTESIVHEKTGFLCDDTPDAFAAAMHYLIQHPEEVGLPSFLDMFDNDFD